jgi:hypothetical protein
MSLNSFVQAGWSRARGCLQFTHQEIRFVGIAFMSAAQILHIAALLMAIAFFAVILTA